MSNEWSTQCARRVRACVVLAMHVPHPGIHTLWRFLCASFHFLPFSCVLVLWSTALEAVSTMVCVHVRGDVAHVHCVVWWCRGSLLGPCPLWCVWVTRVP